MAVDMEDQGGQTESFGINGLCRSHGNTSFQAIRGEQQI
jgi:hypothetical protein